MMYTAFKLFTFLVHGNYKFQCIPHWGNYYNYYSAIGTTIIINTLSVENEPSV